MNVQQLCGEIPAEQSLKFAHVYSSIVVCRIRCFQRNVIRLLVYLYLFRDRISTWYAETQPDSKYEV